MSLHADTTSFKEEGKTPLYIFNIQKNIDIDIIMLLNSSNMMILV